MSLSLTEIQCHRGELLERARAERATVGAIVDRHQNVLRLADRGIALVKLMVARKELFLVAGLAFALVHPRRALRLAFRAWGLLKLLRKVSRALA
jgi:hypothetical protein